jgi:hypothetical protein
LEGSYYWLTISHLICLALVTIELLSSGISLRVIRVTIVLQSKAPILKVRFYKNDVPLEHQFGVSIGLLY